MRIYKSRQNLEVRVEEDGGAFISSLEGAIEAATVVKFRQILDDHCNGSDARIILDCSGLTYMNSASMGLLNKYHRLCEENGGYLAICKVPPKILQLIKLLGLDSMLHLHGNKKDARDAIANMS
jgi:anti-anti-sigma factor